MTEANPLNRVVVFGATEPIGRRVVDAFAAQGAFVRALRPWSSPDPQDAADGVEWVAADPARPDSIPRLMAGCTVAVYAADPAVGAFPARGELAGEDLAEAVGRIRAALMACRELELHRVVVVSSALTLGPMNEREEPSVVVPEGPYGRYRYWMELEARKLAGAGLPVVILNPALVLGPGAPHNAVVQTLRTRRISLSLAGDTAAVDVRDLAELVVRAAERGEPGVRYPVAGHRLSLAELAEAVDRADATTRARLLVPGEVAAALRAIRRRRPDHYGLDPHAFELALGGPRVDDDRARAELGFEPRPLIETLQGIVEPGA